MTALNVPYKNVPEQQQPYKFELELKLWSGLEFY